MDGGLVGVLPPKKHYAFQLQPNPTQPRQPQNESKQQKTPSLRAPAFLDCLDASVPRKDINRDVLEVNGLEVKGSEAPWSDWFNPMVQVVRESHPWYKWGSVWYVRILGRKTMKTSPQEICGICMRPCIYILEAW